jgi:hypothetical protein
MAKSSYMNPKKRTLTKADKAAISHAARLGMISEIEELEQRAHGLGMHVTAHALNNAKNALGWEIAGNIKVAGMAAKGQRVGDGGKR